MPVRMVTEPLRAEHRELLPRIELLRVAAEALEGDGRAAPAGIDAGVSFLREQLIPHAKAEDAVCIRRSSERPARPARPPPCAESMWK